MRAAPPVSIGLPVYNGERYLPITLRDLCGQTYGDFELVVCDNASTDATAEIVQEAATRDPRIRYVRNDENLGALPNANRAFALSRGARYALAGHDDRHAPDFLARLVSALDEDPAAVVAYGDQTLIGADGRPFRFDPERRLYLDADGMEYHYDAALQRDLPVDPVDRYRAVLRSTDINAPIHGLFRREALERIGPHEIHGSDRRIVAHAALLGRFAFVDALLFGYRIHPGSTLHLTRRQWLARETGGTAKVDVFGGLQTLRAYLAATADSDLSPRHRARAVAATLGYAVQVDRLTRLLRPGPDNYWGWTGHLSESRRGPAHSTHTLTREHGGDGWGWLSNEETENRTR